MLQLHFKCSDEWLLGSGIPKKMELSVGTDWEPVTVGWPDACVGAVVLDRDLGVIAVTDALVQRSGHVFDDLVGKNALELVHPGDRYRAQVAWGPLEGDSKIQGESLFRLRVRNGYEAFGIRTVKAPHDDDLVIMHVYEVSAELRASELSRDLASAVRVLAGEFSLSGIAEALQHMTGRQFVGAAICMTVFAADGSPMVFPGSGFPNELAQANERMYQHVLPTRIEAAIDNRSDADAYRHGRLGYHDPAMPGRVVFPMLDDDNDCLCYLDVIRPWDTAPTEHEWLVYGSVAEVMHAAATRFHLDSALRWAADHDSLTGLRNRRGFAKETVGQSHAGGALLMIDLDNFSRVNNELGHAAGDAALLAAARTLTIVSPSHAVLARIGGDEFVAWIPETTTDVGERVANDLRMYLAGGVFAGGQRVVVQASIGLVEVGPGEVLEDAIRPADAAMYLAKERGGNRTVCISGAASLDGVQSGRPGISDGRGRMVRV